MRNTVLHNPVSDRRARRGNTPINPSNCSLNHARGAAASVRRPHRACPPFALAWSPFAVVAAVDPAWRNFSAAQFRRPTAAGQSVPSLDRKRESFGCRQVRERVVIS